jgi:steroid delta-isomerase-like uncharacterized protein
MNMESLTERNKAIYRRFLDEVFNQGRLEIADAMLPPSYVLHEAPPGTPRGPEAVKQVVRMFRSAFPDLKITVEDMVAEGDTVCARATTQGTHRGTIFGIPATGKFVTIGGLTMVRIADGHITESWVKNDILGLMKQLGAKVA